MDIDIIIAQIVKIPERLLTEMNISPHRILKEVHYFEYFDQINENNIFEYLTLYPHYVSYWLLWSENKRTREGCYFIQNEDKYSVGLIGNTESKVYLNGCAACAAFIKYEIEQIRVL